MKNCPCGSQVAYAQCCGLFIEGIVPAPTPEKLMRSRYTAYTLANIPYIMQTMRGTALVGFNPAEAAQWAKQAIWLKLEIKNSSEQGDRGFVEFIASYRWGKEKQTLHEKSEFEKIAGRWYYVNGVMGT